MKKCSILIALLFLLSFINATVSIDFPIGIAGFITVNEEPIEDNITVTITNLNTSESTTAKTENGYYANAISASGGDVIKVEFDYKGTHYENFTTVNESVLTHWVNFSITIEITPSPPCIVIPDTFYGTVGEAVIFDASDCYDLDGEIVKYEWVIYDYPPISLTGKVVNYTWDEPCSLVGLLRVTDDSGKSNTSMFNVVINEAPTPPPSPQNDTNETNENNTNITEIPPVANFTVEGNLTVGEKVFFNSTSYDEDGEIVFWKWKIGNKTYYGERTIVIFDEAGNVTVNLTVKDDSGLNASIEKTIFIKEQPEKLYTLIITANKEVNVKIRAETIVYQGNGTYFVVKLPEKLYVIEYTDGKKYGSDTIYLNRDMEYTITIEESGGGGGKLIPFANAIDVVLSLLIVFPIWGIRKKINL